MPDTSEQDVFMTFWTFAKTRLHRPFVRWQLSMNKPKFKLKLSKRLCFAISTK